MIRTIPSDIRKWLVEMTGNTLPQIKLDDIVRLRKPHPCGSYEWRVTRLGSDIGLVCTGCGRRVLLPRSKFNKQLKMIVQTAGDQAENSPS